MSGHIHVNCECLQGCSGDERMMATEVSDRLFKQYKEVVMEGQEPTEFWVALGGKAPYASDKRSFKTQNLFFSSSNNKQAALV